MVFVTVNRKYPSDRLALAVEEMKDHIRAYTTIINADNLTAAGNVNVDVRIILDPTIAATSLNLSASTTVANAVSMYNKFKDRFGDMFSVISLGQRGNFGTGVEVTIAA